MHTFHLSTFHLQCRVACSRYWMKNAVCLRHLHVSEGRSETFIYIIERQFYDQAFLSGFVINVLVG